MLSKLKQIVVGGSFRKYLFNTGWLMADKILQLILGLFVGIYVAQYLGPERFGILSFAMSFVALFSTFASLDLDGIIVRNMVLCPENRDELLGTSFGLRIIGSCIMLCLVYFTIQLTNSTTETKVIVIIIALGYLFQAFQVIESYFQSQVQAKFVSISSIFGLIISACVKLYLIYTGSSLIWFAIVYLIEMIVKCLMLSILYIINQTFYFFHWRFSFIQAKKLLKDSWPLILSGFAVVIYVKIDQVMIKLMIDNNSVGNYSAAVKLSEAWYFIPIVISQSLYPAILESKKNSIKYYENFQKLYNLITFITIIVALTTTIFSDWIINVLYGYKYDQSSSVLSIHVWSVVFVGLGVASGKWYLSENYIRLLSMRRILGAIVNILLNLLLIPLYSIKGAAISTLIANIVADFLFDLFSEKTRPMFLMKVNSLKIYKLDLLKPITHH